MVILLARDETLDVLVETTAHAESAFQCRVEKRGKRSNTRSHLETGLIANFLLGRPRFDNLLPLSRRRRPESLPIVWVIVR